MTRRLLPLAAIGILVLLSGCRSTPSPQAELTYSGEDLIWGRIQALQIQYEHLRAIEGNDALLAGIAREIVSLAELRMESQVTPLTLEREVLLQSLGQRHVSVTQLDAEIERLRLGHEQLVRRYQ